MTTADLPPPPAAPDQESCCRRGCSPCIFDYYEKAFAAWEAKIRALGGSPEEGLALHGAVKASRPRLPSA